MLDALKTESLTVYAAIFPNRALAFTRERIAVLAPVPVILAVLVLAPLSGVRARTTPKESQCSSRS